MTQTSTLLVAIFIATVAAACTNTDAPEPTEGTIMIWEHNTNSVLGRADRPDLDASNDWDELQDPQGELAAAVCTCEGAECQNDWVEQSFGCGVCVIARCADGGSQGGCSPECETGAVVGAKRRPYTELDMAR